VAAQHPPRVVGLLLAAGSGSRFDAQSPGRKLLEVVAGRPLFEHALRALAAAVDQVHVVTRAEFTAVAAIAAELGARVQIAEQAALGMGHSLAHGARAVGEACHGVQTVVVALADMPWVQSATIEALVAQSLAADRIVQPLHAGQRGNPVAFPARYLSALAQCSGDSGARQLLRDSANELMVLPVDDAGVLRDVDEPGDLAPPGAG
jgi:molybdenum cofactor cytidylyltransferase